MLIETAGKRTTISITSSSYQHNFVNPEKGPNVQNTERRWRELQSSVPRYGNPKHHLHRHLAKLFFCMMEQVPKKNTMKHLRMTDSSMDERVHKFWYYIVKNIYYLFDVFLTMHHSIDFSKYQLNAQFFYFSTIYMLHYAPQHVSSSTLLIIRRTNCITTASGIVPLCKQPYSMLSIRILYGCLQRVTIPEVIQLVLLMMSSMLLETCFRSVV